MELFELLSLLALAVIAAAVIISGLRIYKEHERGVRFRLGRLNKVLGPGLAFAFPYIDSTITVDTRSQVLELQAMKAMTKENATVFLDVAARYNIFAPAITVTKAKDPRASLKSVVESAVRNSVGELQLSQLINKREFINARLREAVSSQAEEWGLGIEGVEILDVTPSERTMRLIDKSARAERKRR